MPGSFTLRGTVQPTDNDHAHLDAETLAAWVDGGVPAPEADLIEQHLSRCGRCQAMLSVLARTEPASQGAARVVPFWSRPPIKWAAGTLAAAAALTLWMWTGPQTTVEPDFPVVETRRAEAQPAPTVVPPAPAVAPPAAPPVVPAPPQVSVPRPAEAKARAAAPPPAAPPPPPPAPLPTAPPPAAMMPPPVVIPREVSVASAASMVSTGEPATFVVVAASVGRAPVSLPVSQTLGAGRGGRGGGAGVAGAARLQSESADLAAPAVRWRVSKGTVVERSQDNGTTWQAAAIDPNVVVTAGSAPFADVCWLVGRNGVVLRSTDGLTFSPVSVPDVVDLKGVEATDANNATVTATDGRVFVTSDGGATWSPMQGNPPTPFQG